MQKITDEEIKKVIYDIIRRRTPQLAQDESIELKNYGFSDKEDFEEFKKAKKIFNFLDVLNIQNYDK
jgi:hypothetical protein